MKNFRNIWPGIVIVTIVLGVLFGILFLDWINDSEKRLTTLITLGIFGLGSIQFIVNQINIDRRKMFDLKYEAYKDIVNKLDSISILFQEEVVDLDPKEFNMFYKNLIRIRNQTFTTLLMHDQYFFKGVMKKSVSKKIWGILCDMEEKSQENLKNIKNTNEKISQSKHEINTLPKDDFLGLPDSTKVFEKSQYIVKADFSIDSKMKDWNNKFVFLESELYKEKYNFYKLLRKYL